MNERKAEFFDSQVDEMWAASAFDPEQVGKIEIMLRQARLIQGMRVIEPGCGTGRLTEILADLVGPEGCVLASDISPKMIEAARRRIDSRENVRLVSASIESCPFPAEGFDAVICHNVFPHFDRKSTTVSHLASALKEGGTFVVFHFMNSGDINDLHRKAHQSVVNDHLPGEPEMRRIIGRAGLRVDFLQDDEHGYLLSAVRA